MAREGLNTHKIGWVGAGRMGYAMAHRLLDEKVDMAVWNRTRDKAEPLAKEGATIVDKPSDLAGRDIVFTVLATSKDFIAVCTGENGVLSVKGKAPRILVDCTSVSEEASAEVRRAAEKVGTRYLASPVSGNAKVVKAGKLTFAVSGPKDAFETVRPYFDAIGTGATYMGEGELARIVKIAHNVLLGVVIQSLAEITVMAEKSGVPRHAFLDFLNKSVMGSMFTRYKTPALVNLDYAMTFSPELLRKDLDLGIAQGHALEVPMPLAVLARDIVQTLIGHGYADKDFASLISLQAQASGFDIKPENVKVGDGLS
jgi:3-hydroxyisobutyrate dehydrogenase-like beta-hydroxyacid dehydrogenase